MINICRAACIRKSKKPELFQLRILHVCHPFRKNPAVFLKKIFFVKMMHPFFFLHKGTRPVCLSFFPYDDKEKKGERFYARQKTLVKEKPFVQGENRADQTDQRTHHHRYDHRGKQGRHLLQTTQKKQRLTTEGIFFLPLFYSVCRDFVY
jgi:hypothetical protein